MQKKTFTCVDRKGKTDCFESKFLINIDTVSHTKLIAKIIL